MTALTHLCFTILTLVLLSLACARPTTPPEDPRASAQRTITAWLDQGDEVGFSYAVVTSTETLFEFFGGRLDAAGQEVVGPETAFLSASSTKVLTSLAILRLVDQGKLRLGDPLSAHFPAHPYGPDVTIRDLLTHTSGVPSPLPLGWLHTEDEHERYDESGELASILQQHPDLKSSPGAEYRYSNLGYWLLGEVVGSASGGSYQDFVTGEILDPLGIPRQELGFDSAEGAPRARGHVARWSALGVLVPLLTDRRFREESTGAWGRFQHLHMNGPAYGGAVGTTRGYAQVLQDLLSERSRVLSLSSQNALFTAQYDDAGQLLPVTLAFRRGELAGEPYFEKPGGGPGFSANVRIYRELGLATVLLSNQMRATEAAIDEVSDALDRPFVLARRAGR